MLDSKPYATAHGQVDQVCCEPLGCPTCLQQLNIPHLCGLGKALKEAPKHPKMTMAMTNTKIKK